MATTLPLDLSSEAPPRSDLAFVFLEAARTASGRHVRSEPGLLARARALLDDGPEGVAAAAALVSAWELPEAPLLDRLPDALWPSYTAWLLAVPAAPDPASCDLPMLGRHLARRCAEIAAWMERNLAAPAVRAIADTYLRSPAPPFAQLPPGPRLDLQLARARILRRAVGRPAAARVARPRRGCALRVGIVHARFDHRAETFATFARCALIDPRRIELHLIALHPTGSALEERAREVAASWHLIGENFAAAHAQLAELALDCLVFGDALAAHPFPLAHLAALRCAPLQIATDPVTTGLDAIDLLLAGELDLTARQARACDERIALLPGTALVCDASSDRPGDAFVWSRAALGVPKDRPLIVTAAPERLDAASLGHWSRLIQANPGATVLLVPLPGAPEPTALRAALAEAASPNLVLHEPAPANHADLASLLSLADLALGLLPPAATLALEAGVPVLAAEGAPASGLLRDAGLDTAVFPTEDALFAAAQSVLSEPSSLAALRAQVSAAMENLPRFADAYALADDFAALLEHAHARLLAEGPGRFRRGREPLRLSTPHSLHPGDLHAEARALLADGRPERAVPCLLSALQRAGADAALWFDLARAYHDAGQAGPAIEALEASLRLQDQNPAGWRLLCTLAADAGNLDLAREALDLAARLAPEHPEMPALRERVAL